MRNKEIMAETTPQQSPTQSKSSREALTWAVLLISFFACIGLTLLVPLSANWFVQNSERRLLVWARSTLGKPSTTLGEVLQPEDAKRRYRTPIGIVTSQDERGVFEITHPDSDRIVAKVEVLGDSEVDVQTAVMPRFGRSRQLPELLVGLYEGTIRIKVLENVDLDGQLIAYINSPNGQVAIDRPGNYTLVFRENLLQVSVYDGRAYLRSEVDELQLQPEERGELGADLRTTGPFPTEINLLTNSDFSQSYTAWTVAASNPEQADQEPASLEILDVNGEPAARFLRDGVGNARVELRQSIDRSIAAFDDMRLNITLGVNNQSLDVCGVAGTECPMTVRIDYIDVDGQERAWQQGFYARGDIGEGTPDICAICGFPLSLSTHLRLPQQGAVFPQPGSSNLIKVLEQEGIRPETIKSLTLKAEGHSFAVDVFDVELIVSEAVTEDDA